MPNSAPEFYLLRHGQSVANVEGRIVSAPRVAETAYGLTDAGRAQVVDHVRAAMERGWLAPGARIVSSPFLRARESALLAAEALGSAVEIEPALRERGFGSLDLGPDSEYERVWEEDRADPAHELWDVEAVQSILARAGALLARIASQGESQPVLLSTHGDVASTLLCAAEGVPLGRHRFVGAMENGEIRPLPYDSVRFPPEPRHA